MNLSTTSMRANTWKAVKQHYFLAQTSASFALLAGVAGLALNGLYFGDRAEMSAVDSEPVNVRQAEPNESLLQQRLIVIYLVQSRESANDIMAAIRNERAESDTPPTMSFAFKATTPEEEASVAAFVETWEGRDIQFLDYRNIAPIE